MTFGKKQALLALLLLAMASCGREPQPINEGQLSFSSGPFEPALPPASVRRIVETRSGGLSLPPVSSAAQEQLAIWVGRDYPWGSLAAAIISSVTGGERKASVFVHDGGGDLRTVALPLDIRLTGAIFAEIAEEWEPDENRILVKDGAGAFRFEYLGQDISLNGFIARLDTVFTDKGELYFPLGEARTKGEFPVVIDSEPDVRLEDVLSVLSVVHSAGYTNGIILLDPR